MKRLARAMAIAVFFTVSPAIADPADLSAARSAIGNQLAAFARGDAEAAFALAAPNITRMFRDQQRFMAMVMSGYAPVTKVRDFSFGRSQSSDDGAVAQEVFLTTDDGSIYLALYTLQRQEDGIYLITGVSMRRSEARGI